MKRWRMAGSRGARWAGAGAAATTTTTVRPSTFRHDIPEDDVSGGDVVSPFTDGVNSKGFGDSGDDDEILPLTIENVEKVLDEMRPYLMSDGGNVRLDEIDGPIVRLELEGACGTCPSSSMTMKMGLERRLKEAIPEILEVVQTLPSAPPLDLEGIELVLDGVRPFLNVAGGTIDVVSLSGQSSLQPAIVLKMSGQSASLQSVRVEIMQRIQRHFMVNLRVDWEEDAVQA